MTKFTPRQILATTIAIAITIAVVYGIFLAGSPSKERDRQFDRQRISHLQQISGAIDSYYAQKKVLPNALSDLSELREYYIESIRDPKTGEQYEYILAGGTTYELCATFVLASEEANKLFPTPAAPRPFAIPEERWKHGPGRACFSFEAKRQELGATCDIYRACQIGQTCAKLPNRAEAICVVSGQECVAAACPGECRLLESYPVQVVCEEETTSPCVLMREKKTGKVDCYGCSGKVCKDPPPGFEIYDAPSKPGYVGIPYSCFETDQGCALAQ